MKNTGKYGNWGVHTYYIRYRGGDVYRVHDVGKEEKQMKIVIDIPDSYTRVRKKEEPCKD